ncbi:MAG TPA: YidC/Oxa1 family membrane protein insertase [Candidatus Magasanikbacteria bacterium]|nr:YidC/Oxa1 family membrane protein insertase [Candidatus Magasanikbacteria bacterium]
MFSYLFHVILYQPILNIFVLLYNIIPGHDIGVVILLITVLVRAAVYPLMSSSIKSQKAVQDLQPKIAEIKQQYKNDQQKQAAATMQLYKENKVNPFASCLPLLIQLPVLIALYMVMRDGLIADNLGKDIYAFMYNPGKLNNISFWIFDMAKSNIVLAVLAGAAQFFQTKAMLVKQPPKNINEGAKDEQMMAMMNKQMLYFMPAMTVFIGATLPAGLTLYWLFSTLLTWGQQVLIYKKQNKK